MDSAAPTLDKGTACPDDGTHIRHRSEIFSQRSLLSFVVPRPFVRSCASIHSQLRVRFRSRTSFLFPHVSCGRSMKGGVPSQPLPKNLLDPFFRMGKQTLNTLECVGFTEQCFASVDSEDMGKSLTKKGPLRREAAGPACMVHHLTNRPYAKISLRYRPRNCSPNARSSFRSRSSRLKIAQAHDGVPNTLSLQRCRAA